MSSLYQKRGIFYYQGKDEDGNRFQKSLRTEDREEAEEKKAKLDERFSTDTPTTLTKLVEDYLERRHRKVERDELSERTVNSDEYAVSFFMERGAEDFGTGHARKYVYLDTEEKNLTIKFKGKLRRIPVEHIWGVFEEMLGRREPLCLHFPSDGEPLQSLFALREVEGRGGKGGCALPSLHLPLHSSRRRYSLAPPGRSRLQGRQNRRAPLGKNTERPSRLSPDGLENVMNLLESALTKYELHGPLFSALENRYAVC